MEAGRGKAAAGRQKATALTSISLSQKQSEYARNGPAVAPQGNVTAAFGAGPPSRSASNSQYAASQSEHPSAKDQSQLDGVNQGRSKYESTALNQLTANILEVMAQGEKSVSPPFLY